MERGITPNENAMPPKEVPAWEGKEVQFPGFVFDRENGTFVTSNGVELLTKAQFEIMNGIVENPNYIFLPTSTSASLQSQSTIIRDKMPLSEEDAQKLLEGYDGGLRLNFPPLQRGAPGYIACTDFSFTMSGFIDLGGDFVGLAPKERRLFLALFDKPYVAIKDETLRRIVDSSGGFSVLNVLAMNVNKKITGERPEIEKPIKRKKGVGFTFEDPLHRNIQPKKSEHKVSRTPSLEQKTEKRAVAKNVDEIRVEGDHPHHWLIDEPNGPESEGICKKCGLIEMFPNASRFIFIDEEY